MAAVSMPFRATSTSACATTRVQMTAATGLLAEAVDKHDHQCHPEDAEPAGPAAELGEVAAGRQVNSGDRTASKRGGEEPGRTEYRQPPAPAEAPPSHPAEQVVHRRPLRPAVHEVTMTAASKGPSR